MSLRMTSVLGKSCRDVACGMKDDLDDHFLSPLFTPSQDQRVSPKLGWVDVPAQGWKMISRWRPICLFPCQSLDQSLNSAPQYCDRPLWKILESLQAKVNNTSLQISSIPQHGYNSTPPLSSKR